MCCGNRTATVTGVPRAVNVIGPIFWTILDLRYVLRCRGLALIHLFNLKHVLDGEGTYSCRDRLVKSCIEGAEIFMYTFQVIIHHVMGLVKAAESGQRQMRLELMG
jgi:hypothetical protein